MEYFYKYRSLANMKRFIDILMNRRLYACKYLDLNDPMEGFFLYDKNVPRNVISKLRDERATAHMFIIKNSVQRSYVVNVRR